MVQSTVDFGAFSDELQKIAKFRVKPTKKLVDWRGMAQEIRKNLKFSGTKPAGSTVEELARRARA